MEVDKSHQAMLRQMMQGEGWKVVMHLIGKRIVYYETQLRQIQLDRDLRLIMLERRNEMLDMVRRLYLMAGEDNPFDVAATALWSTELRLSEMNTDVLPEKSSDHEPDVRHQRHRHAGGIA